MQALGGAKSSAFKQKKADRLEGFRRSAGLRGKTSTQLASRGLGG
jgi:hypothetical protein